MAAIAGAAMMLTIMPLGTQTAVAVDNAFTDGGKVTAYAPTGVGNGTTTLTDQSSAKYTVTANGDKVDAIKYDANGNNFGIARFKSDTKTPVIKVQVDKDIPIETVNIYPQRYYPLAGVIASDDVDGDVTDNIKVSGSVGTSKVGDYTLTYTVSDKAGNTATATRTVTVKTKDEVPPTPATPKPETKPETKPNDTKKPGAGLSKTGASVTVLRRRNA